MPFIPPETIEKARQVDLLTYLKACEPDELVHISGDHYCTRQHDSLKISNGKWYWFSRGFGGYNALDYLIKVREIPFMEAVERITGQVAYQPRQSQPKPEKPKVLLLPQASPSTNRVHAYLRSRGIDSNLIDFCIQTGRLYESTPHHNAVFVGLDKYSKPRYASLRGLGTDFVGDANGSDKRFSLQVMVVFGGTEILFPIHERDCVQDKMIMKVVCLVQMGCYHHLILFTPQASGQRNTNLVSNFRGSFTGSKGLIAVIGYGSILLAKTLFHRHHFFPRCAGVAVDPGHKALEVTQFLINLLCLVAADSVRDNFIQVLTIPLRHSSVFIAFRVGGLVGILCIDHHLAQPAIDPPDGCDRHTLLLHRSGLQHRCRDFLNRSFKLGYGSIEPLDINDIQGVGFLGNLVQIVANAVELLHHGIVVRGRCILRHHIIDKMAQISFPRQTGSFYPFAELVSFFTVQPHFDFNISFFGHSVVLSLVGVTGGLPLSSCLLSPKDDACWYIADSFSLSNGGTA